MVPLTYDPAGLKILRFADLLVTLNDAALEPDHILWAGLTPGFAGLYQINLQLPDRVEADPFIRIRIGDQASAEGVKLAVRP
jgi:uncharacterized protein (TIGR03437 family)